MLKELRESIQTKTGLKVLIAEQPEKTDEFVLYLKLLGRKAKSLKNGTIDFDLILVGSGVREVFVEKFLSLDASIIASLCELPFQLEVSKHTESSITITDTLYNYTGYYVSNDNEDINNEQLENGKYQLAKTYKLSLEYKKK